MFQRFYFIASCLEWLWKKGCSSNLPKKLMPELPEVETITNDLKHTITGATIAGFESDSPKQIIPNTNSVSEQIIGSKIISVGRAGKVIVLRIKNQVLSKIGYIAIHLKMSGRLFLRRKNDPPDKYCHAVFYLNLSRVISRSPSISLGINSVTRNLSRMRENTETSSEIPLRRLADRDDSFQLELRFCDMRKFGLIRLFKSKKELESAVHDKFGPEPFFPSFTVSHLKNSFQNKNTSIKTAIMDQGIISGIGNIYANEALFLAGINPKKRAKDLRIKELKNLREKIIQVLKKGIKYRGSSAKDDGYKDLFGELGLYQKHFLVYEKKGKPCPKKCGSVIKYQRVNGRGTFWCPRCQH